MYYFPDCKLWLNHYLNYYGNHNAINAIRRNCCFLKVKIIVIIILLLYKLNAKMTIPSKIMSYIAISVKIIGMVNCFRFFFILFPQCNTLIGSSGHGHNKMNCWSRHCT